MKLQVLQENLRIALTTASRFTKTKAQLPILSNILFAADKNKLIITATNLENSIAISLGAKVIKEGTITLPASTTTALVNHLSPGTITIESAKEKVKLEGGAFSSTILGINAADFPSVPSTPAAASLKLKSEDLMKALSSCIYSLSVDETRPILTGMLLVITMDKITFVGTDGFRLSKYELLNKSKSEHSVILPKNILLELLRLSDGQEFIEISLNKKDSLAVFGVGDIVLSSRIIQGKYPDYAKIIPARHDILIDIDKEEFLRAIKLAGVFARESANTIKLVVSKGLIQISAKSSKSGSQKMSVDAKVDGIKSKSIEIAFNYKFIEDFLGSVGGGAVHIKITDANSPAVFLDPDDKSFLHLIMPVKI